MIERLNVSKNKAGASRALELAWKELDKRYSPRQKHSQQFVQEFMFGPVIREKDPEKLWEFAENCRTAVSLLDLGNRDVKQLDEEVTQETLYRSMEEGLRHRWNRKRNKHQTISSKVPFSSLAKWISKKVERVMDRSPLSPPFNRKIQSGN